MDFEDTSSQGFKESEEHVIRNLQKEELYYAVAESLVKFHL